MKGIFEIEMPDMQDIEPKVIELGIVQVITGMGAPCGPVIVTKVPEGIPLEIPEVKKSEIKNCLILARKEDKAPYRFGPGGDVHVLLDGYAIVPKEEYMQMKDTLGLCKSVLSALADM